MRIATVLRRAVLGAATLAIVATSLRAQDTGSIGGTVRAAATLAPLADVTLRIEGAPVTALSDSAGHFRLTGVSGGARTLVASRVGFRAARVAVTVQAGAIVTADVVLTEAPVMLSDVVVTATREEERKAEVPANVGVVTAAEIQDTRPHHPAEIVNRVPGAMVVDLGGEGNVVMLRQPINYAAVYGFLEDGIPIRSTGFFNHNALYEINVPGAERIEVFKGPATALYGSDAIAGVFNVLTRPASATPDVEMFAEGASYGYARFLGTASNTWGANGVRADANVTRFDGWRDQAHYDRWSGTLRWDATRSPRSHLRTVLAVSNIDSPGDGGSDVSRAEFDSRATINYTPIAFRKVEAVRLSSAYEVGSDRSLFSATAYARHNRLQLLPFWQLTYDPQVWDSHNNSVGLMLKYRRDLAPGTSLVAGADADYSPGHRVEDEILPTQDPNGIFTSYAVGVRQYDYDVTFHGVSPYVQLEASPTPGLHVSAGARFDAVGYDYTNGLSVDSTSSHRRPASTTVTFTHFSPKLGVSYEFTRALSVFAAYRHGFRVPSEDQLFVQGSAENTVDLHPVQANSYEAGVRAQTGRLALEASVYTMEMRDDILTFYDTLTFTSQTSNAGKTRHRGVEAGLGVVLPASLRLDASYSYMQHRYIEWLTATGTDFGGNDMESGPRDLGNVRLTWAPPRLGSVSLEWAHVGRYYTEPTNQHEYGGYDLLNLYLTTKLWRSVSLVGRFNNVTDAVYAVTASFNPFIPPAEQERFTPGQPRSMYLGVQYFWGGAGPAR